MRMPFFNIQDACELIQKFPQIRGEPVEFETNLPYAQFMCIFRLHGCLCLIKISQCVQKSDGAACLHIWQVIDQKTCDLGLVYLPKAFLYGAGIPEMALEAEPPAAVIRHREGLQTWRTLTGPIVDTCIFAIRLMHCKNITYVDYDPNKGFPWRKQKTGRKKPKPPFVKYKILQINPLKQREQESGVPKAKADYVQRLHTVRGHFKTYTEERPLFGKLTGTFWWGDYVKGNPKFGLVEKDYHLKIDRTIVESLKP